MNEWSGSVMVMVVLIAGVVGHERIFGAGVAIVVGWVLWGSKEDSSR